MSKLNIKRKGVQQKYVRREGWKRGKKKGPFITQILNAR
jgi:hypothetical protein